MDSHPVKKRPWDAYGSACKGNLEGRAKRVTNKRLASFRRVLKVCLFEKSSYLLEMCGWPDWLGQRILYIRTPLDNLTE